jgi:hypothetical protein
VTISASISTSGSVISVEGIQTGEPLMRLLLRGFANVFSFRCRLRTYQRGRAPGRYRELASDFTVARYIPLRPQLTGIDPDSDAWHRCLGPWNWITLCRMPLGLIPN